jgi:hypothetical protein
MAGSVDMILPMLREMRAEILAHFDEIGDRFSRVERRLERLEEAQSSCWQALATNISMRRLLAGRFRKRVETLELKVEQLESQK